MMPISQYREIIGVLLLLLAINIAVLVTGPSTAEVSSFFLPKAQPQQGQLVAGVQDVAIPYPVVHIMRPSTSIFAKD